MFGLERIFSDIIVAKLEPELLSLKSESRKIEISDIPQVAINREMKVLAKGREAEAMRTQATLERVRVLNPFLHPRVIVSDQTIAALVLREFLCSLYERRSFLPRISMLWSLPKSRRMDIAEIESNALLNASLEAGVRFPWLVTDPEFEVEVIARDFHGMKNQVIRESLVEVYFRDDRNKLKQ